MHPAVVVIRNVLGQWRAGGGWLRKKTGQVAINGFADADEQRPPGPTAREVDPHPPYAGLDDGSGFEQLSPECGDFIAGDLEELLPAAETRSSISSLKYRGTSGSGLSKNKSYS